MHLVKVAIRIVFIVLAVVGVSDTLLAKQTAGFSQIALGNNSTCVLRVDYSVACFGYGTRGQMGDSRYMIVNTSPVEAQGFAHGNYLSAGEYHYCIVMSDGFVSCWGDNANHQVSASDMTTIGTALDRKDLGAARVATGGHHSCASLGGGTVQCWGGNAFGQLGDGTTFDQTMPTTVIIENPVDGTSMPLTNVQTVVAGESHTCAKIEDGTIMCWGLNLDGELGLGDTIDRSSPTGPVALPDTAVSVSAGSGHTCAVITNGTLQCWGSNGSGQLGSGDLRHYTSPILVMDDVFPLVGVVSVAAGNSHTCALLSDGTARCWGSNDFGQLGTGNFSPQLIPMPVVDDIGRTQENITAISAGAIHTCAVIDNSQVKCWGDNTFGELGNGLSGIGVKVAYATPSKVEPTLFFSDFEN